jgi:hypothetical protein
MTNKNAYYHNIFTSVAIAFYLSVLQSPYATGDGFSATRGGYLLISVLLSTFIFRKLLFLLAFSTCRLPITINLYWCWTLVGQHFYFD